VLRLCPVAGFGIDDIHLFSTNTFLVFYEEKIIVLKYGNISSFSIYTFVYC